MWLNGPWAGLNLGFVRNFLFLDPVSYYVLMVFLVVGCVILVHNLYNSKFGRAWVAIREDERAAAAMGLNPVSIKLLAFAIGASLSGFAGCYYAAKLSLVDPTEFSFVVSVTVLIMVALGGMGSIPGVIAGALLLYYFEFNLLPGLPQMAVTLAGDLGLGYLNQPRGGWPGLAGEAENVEYLCFGIILLLIMLLRPEGSHSECHSKAGTRRRPRLAVAPEDEEEITWARGYISFPILAAVGKRVGVPRVLLCAA